MNTLQKIFLLLILSFIVKAGFAQCAVGETEVTIHFTKEGQDRFGVRWDFRTANGLSGNGPYASYDSITTCVPYGELTILACNYYDNSWNNAVLEIISTEDGTVNNCSQDGCLIYKSTSIEIADIPNCNFNHPEFELITLDISSCNELIHGCTNPNSFNYNVCADIDDGSCLLPTENNNCINAEMIEVGDFGNCFSYNVTLPNLEYNTFESQEESDFADAYYKFVVPSAGQIRFITNKYSLEAALFEDCNKNTFWLSYDYSNYDELGIIKNLPPGDTLILQVKDSSFGEDFRFCIEEVLPTDNDKFEQAEYIEINKPDECAWVEVNIASNTLYLEPECDGYAYYPYSDAYYKTVVPENGQISFSTEYSYGVGLSIYDHCEKNVLYCGFKSQVPTIKNLTPGDTIILQIISTGRANNQIKFCFTEAPISPNDLCQNAVPLIVYDAGIYSESPQSIVEDFIHTAVDLTHNNLHLVPECFENAESDAFFSFVVPASGQVKIQSTHYIGFALYEYCDEPSIYCANFERYTHKSVIKNLTPGQTLLLQCWRGGYSDKFSISISDAIPSFNNNCTDAKELFVHPHGSCGNNNSYQFRVDVPIENNSIDLLPACSQNVKADVFYKAIVPESGNIKVYTTFVAGLAVYNNCQQAPSYCESDMTKEFLVENLAPGEEVILQFFQDYYPKDFQACIQDYTPPLPPTNNDCSNPLAINLQDLCNEKKLISGKNNNLSITPSCNPDAKADMFYQLSVPESGSIQTIINNKAGVYISGYSLAIYDECNGNEIVCLPNLTNKGVINGLPAGNTVILQIIMETPYDFSLCLKDATPSPNDYCDQAQLIEVNDCLSNINMIDLSFDSGDDNISCSYDRVDVYYKFVVPKNGEIQLTVLKSNAGVGAAIFSACGGEELFCDQSWHNGNISDLPLGETVLLQLSQSNYSKEVFSFCLGKVAPSFNDICANAETVEVSTKGNCEYNLTPFSGFANTAAKLPSCFNGTIHEIVDSYYEFIVPPSGTIKINGGDTGSYWPIQNYAIYESCNGEELHCNYDNHPRKSIGNLPPGEKVILQVFQNEQYSVNFFCIEEVLPTVNSDCSNAELLNISNGWNVHLQTMQMLLLLILKIIH